MAKKHALGFGYMPEETKHHFLIVIYAGKKDIHIYERFTWDDAEEQTSDISVNSLKVVIDKHKWDLVSSAIQQEFNNRLKEKDVIVGRFKVGQVPVERLLGKEMILLLWAIEDCDPSVIPNALKNWFGLSREERWWLFTMANAVTGMAYDKRGWRKALRYALTENPVEEKNRQGNVLEMLYKNI